MTRSRSSRLAYLSLLAVGTVLSVAAPLFPAPRSFEEWREEIASTLEDLRHVRSRDSQTALVQELAQLVKEDVEPRDRYLGELRALLEKAPLGVLFDTIVQELVADGSAEALGVAFEIFEREDYKRLNGRPVAAGEVEIRHRITEADLMLLGDAVFEHRRKGGSTEDEGAPAAITPSMIQFLRQELASENERRVRTAAFLLGGSQDAESVEKLLEAHGRSKDPWTRAVLIEAVGRTDPAAARETILEVATKGATMERLAALPVVGVLSGEDAAQVIASAFEDKKWFVRRAAVAACRKRRDTFAADLLVTRYPEETLRLQYDIYLALLDLTGGLLPPDPKEWPKWWRYAKQDFHPAEPGKSATEGKVTEVMVGQRYFGMEIFSDRLVIAFDSSGSMTARLDVRADEEGVPRAAASRFEGAKSELAKLLKGLNRKSKFNVVAYSDQAKPLGKKLVVASRSNLRKVAGYLKKLEAKGETNLYGALAAGLQDPEVDTIFILSDGEPTRGVRVEPSDIIEAVARFNRFRQTRIHAIQLGEDLELLRLLTRYSDGKYRHIASGSKRTPPP